MVHNRSKTPDGCKKLSLGQSIQQTAKRFRKWAIALSLGVFSLSASTGCTKAVLSEPSDVVSSLSNVAKNLENRPHDPISPYVRVEASNVPPTVIDTERRVVNMTLHECMTTSLRQGNVGSQGGANNAGFTNDSLGQFGGRQWGGSDNIAVLSYDPSISYLDIERSLSKFDARWITSMSWQKLDQPVAAQFIQFQNQQDQASFQSTLAKPLPTGGVAGITTSVNYSKFSNVPTNLGNFVNPNYTPRVQFQFEQPLLQMFGVQANQIAATHPGALFIQGARSTGQGTEGILITRIRYDQQRAEFDRLINQMLLNIEHAYWDLYSSYYTLYAQEEVLKQSVYLLEVVRARVEAGTLRPVQYHQTVVQYLQFQQQVLQARQQVLLNEARLRGLMGMRSDDGTRIVPMDNPTQAKIEPDVIQAKNDALAYRPELLQGRYELKAQQLNLFLQKQLRRPDLRLFTNYDIAGLGTALDGRENQNALHSLITNQFNSWQLGLRLDMPLGFRDANNLVRQAQEQMMKTWRGVEDAERKAMENIDRAYQNIVLSREQIKLAKQSRDSSGQTIDLQNKVIVAGNWDVQTLNQLLLDQQNYARALGEEYQRIAEYNKNLSSLEWARGTIQQYNNVSIAEGDLPEEVRKKAVDHTRSREVALKLREHPAEFALPPLQKFEGTRTLEEKSIPTPKPLNVPGEMKPAPLPAPPAAPAPLPLPNGATPAPSKISSWPTVNPNLQPVSGATNPTPKPVPVPVPVVPAPATTPTPTTTSQKPTTTPNVVSGSLIPADMTMPTEGTLILTKPAGK